MALLASGGPPHSNLAADVPDELLESANFASASGSTSKGCSARLRRRLRMRYSDARASGGASVFSPGSLVILSVPQQLRNKIKPSRTLPKQEQVPETF